MEIPAITLNSKLLLCGPTGSHNKWRQTTHIPVKMAALDAHWSWANIWEQFLFSNLDSVSRKTIFLFFITFSAEVAMPVQSYIYWTGSILPLTEIFPKHTRKKSFIYNKCDWLRSATSTWTRTVWLPNETNYSCCSFVQRNTPHYTKNKHPPPPQGWLASILSNPYPVPTQCL